MAYYLAPLRIGLILNQSGSGHILPYEIGAAVFPRGDVGVGSSIGAVSDVGDRLAVGYEHIASIHGGGD